MNIQFKKLTQKRLIFNKMNIIEKLQQNTSFRPNGAPFILNFNQYNYKYVKYLKKTQHFKYVCENGYNRHKKIEERCPAYILVSFEVVKKTENEEEVKLGQIIQMNVQHNCIKKIGTTNKFIKDSELKSKIDEIYYSQMPRPTQSQIITQLTKKINSENNEEESKIPISQRIVYNQWSKLNRDNKINDTDFGKIRQTNRKTDFELFKFRCSNFPVGKNLFICYSSKFQQSLIQKSSFIFIDGTFDVTPDGFEQVLVLLGRTEHMNIPLAHFLLPNKEKKTYELAFLMFINSIKKGFQNGATFITDFELGESNAVKKILMNETHIFQYCYFHFSQIMRRYFDKYQKFEFLDKLKNISYLLPFISERLLNTVIKVLSQWEITDQFSLYFEYNFKNKYRFNDWNVYNKINKDIITNNVAESHNAKLKDRIGHHPTLANFEEIIQQIEEEDHLRYELKEIDDTEIKRIDEDTFIQIFKNFITDLRRAGYKQKKNTNSDTSIEKYDQRLNNELLFDDDKNEITDIVEEDDTDDKTIIEEINELENAQEIRLVNEAYSIPKVHIKTIPTEAQQILQENLINYRNAPGRSTERKRILSETFTKIQEISPNITKTQVRSWFNNNMNKI